MYPLDGESGGRDVGPQELPAAQFDSLATATGPRGHPSGSFQLRGGHVEILNDGSLDTRRSTSILLWVYHEGQAGPIVDYQEVKTPNLWLTKEDAFSVQFTNRDRTEPLVKALETPRVPPRTWHHLAAVYDYPTGTASVWLNGTLISSADIGQKELATDTKVVRMGALFGVAEIFTGRVSCLQFYDVGLTGEQISALMEKCKKDPGRKVTDFKTSMRGNPLM